MQMMCVAYCLNQMVKVLPVYELLFHFLGIHMRFSLSVISPMEGRLRQVSP